jgi:hypothetical protein
VVYSNLCPSTVQTFSPKDPHSFSLRRTTKVLVQDHSTTPHLDPQRKASRSFQPPAPAEKLDYGWASRRHIHKVLTTLYGQTVQEEQDRVKIRMMLAFGSFARLLEDTSKHCSYGWERTMQVGLLRGSTSDAMRKYQFKH